MRRIICTCFIRSRTIQVFLLLLLSPINKMMSDQRRYRYETDVEAYANGNNYNVWSNQQYEHSSYVPQQQQHNQHQQQYYPATSSGHGLAVSDHYTHPSAIPLSPPSSRPVSVSPNESLPDSSAGHLMPLYSSGRSAFQQSDSNTTAYTVADIKPDPDCEDHRNFYQQQRRHDPSDKV